MEKKIVTIASIAALLGLSSVFVHTSALAHDHDNDFSITNITANCSGTGTVSYTGSIPNGGIVLTLFDQHLGQGNGFVISNPIVSTTITSGSSPVSYSLNLSGWTGGPHYRVDSNFNTKSESLYCEGATPTVTPTPTGNPTATPTPTPICNSDHKCDPTATPTPTVTVTDTPTPTPTTTSNGGGNGGGDGLGCATHDCSGNQVGGGSSTQAVLGASTMASTGVFEENAMNLMGEAGIILMGLSAVYAKAKKALNR